MAIVRTKLTQIKGAETNFMCNDLSEMYEKMFSLKSNNDKDISMDHSLPRTLSFLAHCHRTTQTIEFKCFQTLRNEC